MPRDFLADDMTPQSSQAEKMPRDFLAENMPEQETMGKSAALAIPRVLTDVATSGWEKFKNIPKYWNAAKSGIPEAAGAITQNPAGAGKQAVAGLAEYGQNVFNTPHDFINYLTNRLHLFPEDINKKVQMGRMPDSQSDINATFGVPQSEGEQAIRFAGRNAGNALGLANIPRAIKSVSSLNPMSAENIAKNVVKTEKKMYQKYSGDKGLYNKLSKEASNRGITQANINPGKIDIGTIKKYSPEKDTVSLDAFMADKNLNNAQKAISDLGYTERRIENKASLNSEEQAHLKAVKKAKAYIQDNMFKDSSGKVHQDLLNKHKEIQKGYATEVVPYTKNKAIQAYKKGQKLPDELVDSLSRGKFAAMRGENHPWIGRRKSLNPFFNQVKKGGALGLGLTGGGFGGKEIYDYLFGNEGNHQ